MFVLWKKRIERFFLPLDHELYGVTKISHQLVERSCQVAGSRDAALQVAKVSWLISWHDADRLVKGPACCHHDLADGVNDVAHENWAVCQ